MAGDGDRFIVRMWPWQFNSDRMRHRAPSRTTVQRMANTLSRPVRSNSDAQEHVRIVLALLHYWPSAFAPLVAELQRRRTIALRRDRLARRRRQRRQHQEGAVERSEGAVGAADDEEFPMMMADEMDLPVPHGPPVAISP